MQYVFSSKEDCRDNIVDIIIKFVIPDCYVHYEHVKLDIFDNIGITNMLKEYKKNNYQSRISYMGHIILCSENKIWLNNNVKITNDMSEFVDKFLDALSASQRYYIYMIIYLTDKCKIEITFDIEFYEVYWDIQIDNGDEVYLINYICNQDLLALYDSRNHEYYKSKQFTKINNILLIDQNPWDFDILFLGEESMLALYNAIQNRPKPDWY